MPVCQDLFHDRPFDHFLGFLLPVIIVIVDGLYAAKGDVAELEELGLIRIEPLGAGWGVGEEKEARNSDEDGEQSFEDEDCLLRSQSEIGSLSLSLSLSVRRRHLLHLHPS